RAGNGGGPASHTPAPESSTTVASFRTWRGLRIIVAGGETGDGVPVARRRDVERPARRAGPGEPPGRVACGLYRRGAKRVPSGPGRRQALAHSAGRKWRRPCQPHPGTRVFHYRCFLPDLAGFADYRRGGRDGRRGASGTPSRCRAPGQEGRAGGATREGCLRLVSTGREARSVRAGAPAGTRPQRGPEMAAALPATPRHPSLPLP